MTVARDPARAGASHPGVSLTISPGSRQVLRDDRRQRRARRPHRRRRAHPRVRLRPLHRHGPGARRPARSRCAPSTATSRAAAAPRTPRSTSCSPEVAAATALAGVITDPRTLGDAAARRRRRAAFLVDDGMIVPPPATPASGRDRPRPEHQAAARRARRSPTSLEGEVLLKVGDNITTDHIMPAGAKVLPLRSNIPAISEFVFAAVDPEFPARAKRGGRRLRHRRRATTARAPAASTRRSPRCTSACGR